MLVGRQRERSRIDELIRDAAAARGGALALVGEPGIGKTALLEYARGHAATATIVETTGVESELALPFAGLVDVLRPLLGHVADLPEPHAQLIRTALALGPPGPIDRLATGAAVLGLLAAAAADRPLLVLVDDAQWLDTASRDALLFAGRRLGADPVALLFASRDDEPLPFAAVGVETLVLGGLTTDEAASLLEGAVAPAAVGTVVELTQGNPLALLELPATLSEAQLAGDAPVEQPVRVSAGIERAFARRALLLGEDVRRALLVAAADDSGSLEVVQEAARFLGVRPEGILAAEDAALVHVAGPRLAFHHPLVRAAVYQGAAPSERRDAHRALAAVLEGRDELRHAWHAAAAATGHDAAAARALASVASTSRSRGAYAAAAAAFERAARLTDEPDAGHAWLAQAAEAAWLAGHGDQATALVDEGLSADPAPIVRAELLGLRGRMSLYGDDQERAHESLLRAAELARDVDPALATAFLSEAVFAGIQLGGAAVAETAARLATVEGEGEALRELLVAEAFLNASSVAGELGDRERLERALVDAEADGALDRSPLHLLWAGRGHWSLGHHDESARLARRALELARREAALAIVPLASRLLAHSDFERGRWRSAYVAAGEAVEVGRELGQESTVCASLAVLAEIHAAEGDRDACRAVAEEAIGIALARGLGFYRERSERALGRLELALGRSNQAIERLEAVDERLRQAGNRELNTTAAWDLVEAYARAGALPDARAVFARAEKTMPPASPLEGAVVERCRGIVDDGSSSGASFERALAFHEAERVPFDHARTHLVYGERLRRAGERKHAREHLHAALGVFDDLGARAWARRARDELAATGERLRSTPEARESLTPRELQIALAVAEGATNNEVAAALYLTPKTVEYHLTRVYRKLGLRSRTEVVRHFTARSSDD